MKVAVGSRAIDGIVFDATGGAKVVVAMVDRERGPVMRTVELKALSDAPRRARTTKRCRCSSGARPLACAARHVVAQDRAERVRGTSAPRCTGRPGSNRRLGDLWPERRD